MCCPTHAPSPPRPPRPCRQLDQGRRQGGRHPSVFYQGGLPGQPGQASSSSGAARMMRRSCHAACVHRMHECAAARVRLLPGEIPPHPTKPAGRCARCWASIPPQAPCSLTARRPPPPTRAAAPPTAGEGLLHMWLVTVGCRTYMAACVLVHFDAGMAEVAAPLTGRALTSPGLLMRPSALPPSLRSALIPPPCAEVPHPLTQHTAGRDEHRARRDGRQRRQQRRQQGSQPTRCAGGGTASR